MRLDNYLTESGYFETRTKAKQAIERGEIFINGKLVKKPSTDVNQEVKIDRITMSEYVSVGGFKLEKALNDFNLSVKDLIVADIGASTGGFTDCLLKNGANYIYPVDLRDDLLHEKLKKNPKVHIIVKNAKSLTKDDFDRPLDLIVADLSFISVVQVLKVFSDLIDSGKKLIILIKPQFETGQKRRFKNGIIRDKKIHQDVCKNIYTQSIAVGLCPQKITTAPLSNEKNTEFLILLEKGGSTKLSIDFLEKI